MQDTPQRCPSGLIGRYFAKARPPKMRKFDRVKILANRVYTFRIVSSRICGIITHHVDFRDQVCTETNDEPCWISHELTSSRYHGWLAVVTPPSNVIQLVALTDCAVYCDPRFEDDSYSLRGHTLRLKRVKGYDWAEMSAQLVDGAITADGLPLEPNMVIALGRMFDAPDDPNGIVMKRFRAQQERRQAHRRANHGTS